VDLAIVFSAYTGSGHTGFLPIIESSRILVYIYMALPESLHVVSGSSWNGKRSGTVTPVGWWEADKAETFMATQYRSFALGMAEKSY
jgi:hypothetical protein